MTDKLKKVSERLDEAKQVTDIGKVIAPGNVGSKIGKAGEIIDAAQTGLTLGQRIASIFKKKKR